MDGLKVLWKIDRCLVESGEVSSSFMRVAAQFPFARIR